MEISIDSKFECQLLPLAEAEQAMLAQSLISEGCREPLTVWENAGKQTLVDGHNRFKICKKHGISYDVAFKEFSSREEVSDWIDRNQVGRRNISPSDFKILSGRIFSQTCEYLIIFVNDNKIDWK